MTSYLEIEMSFNRFCVSVAKVRLTDKGATFSDMKSHAFGCQAKDTCVTFPRARAAEFMYDSGDAYITFVDIDYEVSSASAL